MQLKELVCQHKLDINSSEFRTKTASSFELVDGLNRVRGLGGIVSGQDYLKKAQDTALKHNTAHDEMDKLVKESVAVPDDSKQEWLHGQKILAQFQIVFVSNTHLPLELTDQDLKGPYGIDVQDMIAEAKGRSTRFAE